MHAYLPVSIYDLPINIELLILFLYFNWNMLCSTLLSCC